MYPELDMLCRPVPGRRRHLAGVALGAALLSACSFAPEGPGVSPLDPDGGPPPPIDATEPGDVGVAPDTLPPVDAPPDAPPEPPRPRDVVHVPEEGWEEGDHPDVTWTDDVTINTTTGSFTGPGTAGLALFSAPQSPSGPELALLHVGDLIVNEGVEVRVTGSRPLVIISSGSITLNGVIDAGADRQTPGPGGAGPGQGAGEGADGLHRNGDTEDSGGSGAGHATEGARGGPGCGDEDCDAEDSALGPAGGPVYGDAEITELTGGSGGGRGGEGDGSCSGGDGGAGGGAVQLYAVATITIGASGGISVGGGGGQGGDARSGLDACAASAGGGGGSGGAVYLQAARIELAGTLAANGGGGAAGATGGTSENRGASGANGALSATPAAGGPDETSGGSAGGDGGAGSTAPTPGVEDDGNGGGGGGAVGRIVLHCTELDGAGLTSPDAFRTQGCS